MAINPRIPTDNFPPTWPVPSNALPIGLDLPVGPGVPSGGTTGQKLVKSSPTSYDTEWADDTGGASVTISDEPPADPVNGAQWKDSTDGTTSTWDSTADAWIEND